MDAPAIYQAHPVTGEYLGSGFADPDPLQLGEWLVPGHAYLDAPTLPAPEGHVMVRVENGWQPVEDHRGLAYRKIDGTVVVLNALGPVPAELTLTAQPGPFYVWSDATGWTLDEAAELDALRADALSRRIELLSEAALEMAPLQDAVGLQMATIEEQARLEAWQRYRVELGRIEQQEGFPRTIVWPTLNVILPAEDPAETELAKAPNETDTEPPAEVASEPGLTTEGEPQA